MIFSVNPGDRIDIRCFAAAPWDRNGIVPEMVEGEHSWRIVERELTFGREPTVTRTLFECARCKELVEETRPMRESDTHLVDPRSVVEPEWLVTP